MYQNVLLQHMYMLHTYMRVHILLQLNIIDTIEEMEPNQKFCFCY